MLGRVVRLYLALADSASQAVKAVARRDGAAVVAVAVVVAAAVAVEAGVEERMQGHSHKGANECGQRMGARKTAMTGIPKLKERKKKGTRK